MESKAISENRFILSMPELFIKPISIMNNIKDEVTFKVNKDNIEILEMDLSNVCMFNFKIFDKSFSVYELTEPFNFSVNLSYLKDVLKNIHKNSSIEFSINENELNLLEVKTDNTINEYSLKLLDVDEENKPIPTLDFSVIVEMDNKLFYNTIKDLFKNSEGILFNVTDDLFIFESVSQIVSLKKSILLKDCEIVKKEGNVKSKYSTEYLKAINNNFFNDVSISFSEDYPIQLTYKNDYEELSFIVAPRVSND